MARHKPAGEQQAATPGAAGSGALYVVATPIGNLQDISRRALEVLAFVDLILAEDTRHSARLLAHYGITTACRSFHDHNESRQVDRIVERIAAGERIALVSDAGTPLISDPGFRLVAALREHGQSVIPVPGPSALICALCVAGLATDRFCFEGFLPVRTSARRSALQALASERRTLIFYESPRRILGTVADLAAELGASRPAVLARELTKVHESVTGGTLAELHAWLEAHAAQCRGEFVIVVAGAACVDDSSDTVELSATELMRALLEELPVKQAVSVVARLTGAKRNALYQQAIALSGDSDDDGAGGNNG